VNIWLVVILVVVVALIVGPVMMLKPNPAQQKKEQLRLRAHHSGLRFAMRALPKLKTDMDAPTPMPVYYLPPKVLPEDLRDWMLLRTAYAHEGNFYQEWDWHGSDRPDPSTQQSLKDFLPQLPAGVKAIAAGHQGVSVYWDEKNGEEVFPVLLELLTSLAHE